MAKDTIDLMGLEPNIPSKDFGSYTTHLSAPPKYGKSEFCTEFEKPLIFDFEEGTKGKVVYRVPIENWSQVKKYTKQLTKTPELKEKYKTVCFDTVNYALEFCKQYVINEYQNNHPDKLIDTFNKIPYGGGWELLGKEFKSIINQLKRAGYGVVMVSHIKDKIFDKETEQEHTKTVPDLTDRERNMISAMADFLLLGEFEVEVIEPAEKDGNGKIIKEAITKTNRVLNLRTNNKAEAGFRWETCPEQIPFDIEILKKVFTEAVENEILNGKSKFGIEDEEAKKIRKKLDKEKEEKEQESFEIKNYISEIKDAITNLTREGIKVPTIKKELKKLNVKLEDIERLEDVELAKNIVEVCKSLLPEKE